MLLWCPYPHVQSTGLHDLPQWPSYCSSKLNSRALVSSSSWGTGCSASGVTWGGASWWHKVNYLRREKKSPAEETFTLNLPCVTRKAQPLKELCAATSGSRHQREREHKKQTFPSAALIKQLIRCELRWMCCCSLWVWVGFLVRTRARVQILAQLKWSWKFMI